MFWIRRLKTIVIMYRLTLKGRAEIVSLFIEMSPSVVLTQRVFSLRYHCKEAPCDKINQRLVSSLFIND